MRLMKLSTSGQLQTSCLAISLTEGRIPFHRPPRQILPPFPSVIPLCLNCCGPESAANASSVGKGVALGHPLPVVAMGSIPHIYRHASFSLRATPPSLPRQGKTRRFFRMSRLSQFQQKLSRLIKPSCASFALTNR
jgi:hypothetical protein